MDSTALKRRPAEGAALVKSPLPSRGVTRWCTKAPLAVSGCIGGAVAVLGWLLVVLLWRDIQASPAHSSPTTRTHATPPPFILPPTPPPPQSLAVTRAKAAADAEVNLLAISVQSRLARMVQSIDHIAVAVAAEAPQFSMSTFRSVRRTCCGEGGRGQGVGGKGNKGVSALRGTLLCRRVRSGHRLHACIVQPPTDLRPAPAPS